MLAVLPGVYQNHLLLFNFVIFLILAQGVNIIYGFTGYLPFGYVGFFGAGAYGFAILVMHFQAPAVVAVLAGGIVGVALGLLLTPLLRLSGAYFAIANLAASLAVLHFVANPALEGITRGPYGVALNGTFNPTMAYAAALVVLALTLGAVVFLKKLSLRPGAAGGARGCGVGLDGRRQCGANAGDRVAGVGAGRRPRRRRLCLVRLGVLSRQRLQRRFQHLCDRVRAVRRGCCHHLRARSSASSSSTAIYNLIGFTTPQYFQLIYGLLIMGLVLFLPAGLVSLATRRGWHVP